LQGVGGASDWRWMLGVLAVPSLIYTIMVLAVPESPRWLISVKNNLPAAKKILARIGVDNPDEEVNNIVSANAAVGSQLVNERIFNGRYKKVLWLGFLVAFFNQLSGINFILYYAPEILSRIGLGTTESLANSIAIGGTNLVFTFVGLFLIDRLGRKTLLVIGSLGYIISLSMVALAFKMDAGATFMMIFLLLFIASHAIGQGAVIWVFIAEIFPNKVRALGQSFGASTHWVFAAIITLITPLFLDKEHGVFGKNPWPIFVFFAFMMVLQLVWVLTKVPETKGASLEELEKKLLL
jgi:sugar porter (SP) family MFS transporter